MKYFKETVRKLSPYAWEDSSERLAKKLRMSPKQILRFDMNTSPFVPSRRVYFDAAKQAFGQTGEYPDPAYESLATLLADYAGCNEEGRLVVCAGCDEVIDVVCKAFVDKGSKVVVSAPTYSLGNICAEIAGARVETVMRNPDYSIDSEKLVDACKKASLLYLCNPNSPTGNAEELEKISGIVESVDCAVFLDEAYCEFWGKSLAPMADKYPNLIVGRTLSKACGLAGARIGYSVSSAEIAAGLNKVRPPNSVSAFSVALARGCLKDRAGIRKNIERLVAERKRFEKRLEDIGIGYAQSVTNFLLLQFGSPQRAAMIFDSLLARGMVLRNFSSKPGLESCLRASVRTKAEDDALLGALAQLAGEAGG